MAPRKALANGDTAVPIASKAAPGARLPASVRFPLLVILSLTFSSGLYTIVGELTSSESASVSRSRPDEVLTGALLVWKVVLLAIGWFGGFDPYDVAYLSLLINFPFHYLRTTFYDISPYTSLVSLLADYLSVFAPAYLLRARDPIHNPAAPPAAVPNRNIISDFPTIVGTSLFAACIYSITLFLSYRTFLPGFFVTRFEGLRSLSQAYESQVPIIVLSALPVGYAASDFLLWHYISAQPSLSDITRTAFNPKTASLLETLVHNLWGYSKRTRVLVSRTVTLAALTGLNTWFRTWSSLEGAESSGAAGWAGIWAGATLIVGAAFAWVGDV